MMSILAEATGGMVGTLGMIIWLVVLFAIMYFLMIRPQKKEQEIQFLLLRDSMVQLLILRMIQ